jgi:hypothetical protein
MIELETNILETQEVSETFVFGSAVTVWISQYDFFAYIHETCKTRVLIIVFVTKHSHLFMYFVKKNYLPPELTS